MDNSWKSSWNEDLNLPGVSGMHTLIKIQTGEPPLYYSFIAIPTYKEDYPYCNDRMSLLNCLGENPGAGRYHREDVLTFEPEEQ